MAELSQGDMAPSFSLPHRGGGTLSLLDLRGRTVVLYFYPKDDTQGCTAEAIDFSTLKENFEAAGATIIGVSPDSPKRHSNFASKYDLSIDMVSDGALQAVNSYGMWVGKSMYGRSFMGVARSGLLI